MSINNQTNKTKWKGVNTSNISKVFSGVPFSTIRYINRKPEPGDIGIFGGGYSSGSRVNTIDYVTISLLGNAADFGDLTLARSCLAGTSNGISDRGVFCGGYNSGQSPSDLNVIDYVTISSSGNATDFGDLIDGRYYNAATSNGTNDRGVSGGGSTGGGTFNEIYYITISSTGNATDFGDLAVSRNAPAAASNGVGDRGIFYCGDCGGEINSIEYITISSTGDGTDFGDAIVARYRIGGTSNGINERGVFGGGRENTLTYYYNEIEYITISSTGNATDFGDLIDGRYNNAATSNGTNDRGVFGGGAASYGSVNIMDYVTISSIGDASDFGDLSSDIEALGAASNGLL